jgi:hypothetical protein
VSEAEAAGGILRLVGSGEGEDGAEEGWGGGGGEEVGDGFEGA